MTSMTTLAPPVIRPSIKRLISRNTIRRRAVRPIRHQISSELLRVFDKSNNGAQTVGELKNRILRILESKPC